MMQEETHNKGRERKLDAPNEGKKNHKLWVTVVIQSINVQNLREGEEKWAYERDEEKVESVCIKRHKGQCT